MMQSARTKSYSYSYSYSGRSPVLILLLEIGQVTKQKRVRVPRCLVRVRKSAQTPHKNEYEWRDARYEYKLIAVLN